MHQHPRPPPSSASPATSQRTNPLHTNNPREPASTPTPPPPRRSSVDLPSPSDAIATEAGAAAEATPRAQRTASESRDAVAKLNQVVQNFYTKAALLILSHRVSLSPAMSKETGEKRVNKWFNVEVDETNDLLDSLRLWKTSHILDQRPLALIIEVYIEAGGAGQQSLILQDERGHQWGVEDAIKSYIETSGDKMPTTPRIVLERWRCHLGRQSRELPADLPTVLPKVYKNSIVLFRSLFAYVKFLPAWELTRKRHLKSSQRPPKMMYRIYAEGSDPSEAEEAAVFDELELALDDGRSPVTEHFAFDPIESPAGPYAVEVTYRQRCDFRWERSMESVYSSKFIGQDEDLFRPSLDRYNTAEVPQRDSSSGREEVVAMPQRRPNLQEMAEQSQAYGSLSTYHNTTTRVSSSPISALRAARDMNMRSPTDPSPPNQGALEPREAGARTRDRADTVSGAPRRTSVSIMPFKTHSLSASPLQTEMLATAPHRSPQPIGRTSALTALANARRPSNARDSPLPAAEPPASLSSSPRPSRYSSSFGHRRARLSVGGSKTEDDNSSGKASVASSAQPGSTVIAGGGGGGGGGGNNSSGSLHTDDDNISGFLKMLDQTRELKSFQAPVEASSMMEASKRLAPGLAKYQRLRDTNLALTESMSSSLQMQRSPSGSSQQQQQSRLPAGPAVAAGSGGSSSSPAERMSPRTPHTPAVPSRLSANSIIEYTDASAAAAAAAELEDDAAAAAAPRDAARTHHHHHHHHHYRHDSSTSTSNHRASSNSGSDASRPRAIDIPTSPRFNPSYRRASSAVNREGRVADYDLGEVLQGFATRSASMGDREREERSANTGAPSTGGKSSLGVGGGRAIGPSRLSSGLHAGIGRVGGGSGVGVGGGVAMDRERSNDSAKSADSGKSGGGLGDGSGDGDDDDSPISPRFRPRLGGGGGHGARHRPTHGSSTSLAGASGSGGGGGGSGGGGAGGGSGSATSSEVRSSRYSFTRPPTATLDDEEPLLFAMSDFTAAAQPGHGRKSIDETVPRRPGSGAGESSEPRSPRSPRVGGRKWA